MNTLTKLVFVIGAVLTASFFTARTITLKSETARKPFVATVVVRMYKPSGALSRTENNLYAVAADGSDVEELRRELPNNTWGYLRKIRNASSGLKIVIEPATRSVATVRMAKGETDNLLGTSSNCGAQAGAPTRTILGYVTVRSYKEVAIDSNQSVRVERWRAPTLDCYTLYQRGDVGPKNGPSAYDITEVLFIVEGNPPRALFQVPSGLVERSPSQMNSEFEQLFPGHHMYVDGGTKADRPYFANRPS